VRPINVSPHYVSENIMTDNSDKEPHDDISAEQQLLGKLRLLADAEQAIGPKPDLKEIQDWHLGKLDVKRAAQVKSHVARDPQCYALWSELLASESGIEPVAVKKPAVLHSLLLTAKAWWTRPTQVWMGTGLATALAVLVVVVMLPGREWSPLDNPIVTDLDYNWPYENLSITRSGELPYRYKVAIQSGVRVALEKTTRSPDWGRAIQALPQHALPCEGEKDQRTCQAHTSLSRSIGVVAGAMYLACLEQEKQQQRYFDDKYWQLMTTSWQQLAVSSKDLHDAKLTEKILQIGTSTAREQQCENVRDVIFMSY
jgi:hypothetical protein